MFKGEIWDKFTKFTFFEILKSPEGNEGDFEISKFQKNFSQISRIKHVIPDSWLITCDKALKEHTRVRITQKTINQYQ